MIRIINFRPINHFSRSVIEFDDAKLVQRFKSLSFETEKEIDYPKIKKLEFRRRADINWIWSAFILSVIVLNAHLWLGHLYQHIAFLLILEKALTVICLLLCIPAFRKEEILSLISDEEEYLISIWVSRKDRLLIEAAIRLIKEKTEIRSETSPSSPFPEDPPAFELIEYDLPYFLKRSTKRFYPDRMLEWVRGLAEDVVQEVLYERLNGETKEYRIGNRNWSYAWSYLLVFLGLTLTLVEVFFPQLISIHRSFAYLWIAGLALIVPLWLFEFIKRDFIAFNDLDEDVALLLKRTSHNRETVAKVVEYIQSQIQKRKRDFSQENRPDAPE
jgi:hypothetical protein